MILSTIFILLQSEAIAFGDVGLMLGFESQLLLHLIQLHGFTPLMSCMMRVHADRKRNNMRSHVMKQRIADLP